MTILDRWLQYLDGNGVHYSHSIHRPSQTALATASAERVSPHDLVKAVVYAGDNGFGIAVIAAGELVDLTELGRLLGSSHIRLADERELAEIFSDCELGAMPPFGQPYEMPVLLDTNVASREFIAFPIGTHVDVVRISMEDYRRLVRPLVGSFILARTSVL